jgi:hypothetical protein
MRNRQAAREEGTFYPLKLQKLFHLVNTRKVVQELSFITNLLKK